MVKAMGGRGVHREGAYGGVIRKGNGTGGRKGNVMAFGVLRNERRVGKTLEHTLATGGACPSLTVGYLGPKVYPALDPLFPCALIVLFVCCSFTETRQHWIAGCGETVMCRRKVGRALFRI